MDGMTDREPQLDGRGGMSTTSTVAAGKEPVMDNGMNWEGYAKRLKRVEDAIALREPDRVPTALFSMFWHAKNSGVSCRDVMYDYDRLAQVYKPLLLELEPDMYALPQPMNAIGPAMENMGFRQLKWPGHGCPENVSYQYLDREYMKADEYEQYLFDPTGYYLSTYLPRVADAFQGLSLLPALPGLYYLGLVYATMNFSDAADSFATLARTGEEVKRMMGKAMGFGQEMAQLGFPGMVGAVCTAPFDYFGDCFRGSKGIMLDMHRRKDELLAAMEKALPFILKQAVNAAAHSPCKRVFIPLHWCFDSFMSDAQFKTFYWPTLRKLMLQLIEHGLTPMPLWEGNCTSRLEVIGDIPRGKALYGFEHTDLVRAKEVLGDIVCLRGNVPASMLCTGTPDQVDAFSRRLIEKVGKGGGFILDGPGGIPDEARYENVQAMFAAAKKYSA